VIPSSVSCITTAILLHSKHTYSPPNRWWWGKGSFTQGKRCRKTQIRPPPLNFAACWWSSTQVSLRRRSGPQKPGILLSLLLAVTLGVEGGKEHFRGATFGGATFCRLGMSVLRDSTYDTLGARASLRAPEPLAPTSR
jgi:hypothetical protein